MEQSTGLSRRTLLAWIGKTAGAAAMYQAMTALSFAGESSYKGHFELSAAPAGASVLVLGAGLAGMTAAYELRKAGYKVKVLEYNAKAGGRCWTLRGGDRYTELGGTSQDCRFDQGLYFNPGPWRIPYHHHAILDYCGKFGVRLEPFIQVNHNALLHSSRAFNGQPKRYREVQADYQGHIAELLSKSVKQGALDQPVSAEDREKLLESLRVWAGLDDSNNYIKSIGSSMRRGFAVDAGGGLMPEAVTSDLLDRQALLQSGLWLYLMVGQLHEFQTSIFQPVGGMDMIAQAFAKQIDGLVRYNAKVTRIQQNDSGVTVTYEDTTGSGGTRQEKADWCVCTLPLSILSQLQVDVAAPMQNAIRAVPYGASAKIGLQFKRRFWEQDERIYGGISYTDAPIGQIGYPNCDYGSSGKGVLLGGYVWQGKDAFEFTAMSPEMRVKKALEQGSQLHPQYREEFDNGIAVGWHRVPWTHGCYGVWSDEARKAHYHNLCQIDGRLILAGEHVSHLPAWQEGAILSAQDAISRLHRHAVARQTAA
ncbi:monoamine oxidase [Geopseudomonas sagittaria]|uniref:Tryptophan 2-monooxygenase n=1 Tax=Geopseudomonas sagittaria TaxID=1135990 RepID=A0A1I5XHB1_9GAMM|nr:flavin monoamine oxidase family protein [Pseudomonas sagittaria]SFQ31358.1 monoamine oxidase [Pseudomonas sagittaria]